MPNQQFGADNWQSPTNTRYRPYLISLMSHFHRIQYPSMKTFTREELLALTPGIIKNWMANKAYGNPVYNPEVDRPSYARSSTLEMMKKAVSFFMPNKDAQWIISADGTGQGNPTKSPIINGLIKEVKRHEVRGEGATSRVKRPLRQQEFRKTLELLKSQRLRVFDHRFKYPCISITQYTLIGRVDDCCELQVKDPRGHSRFPFAIKTKVRWSKNVHEERSCPDQILLASMDPTFCQHLHLATYMEIFLQLHPNAKYLFTEADGNNAVKNIIAQYRRRLARVVWAHDDFKDIADEDDQDQGNQYRRSSSLFSTR